MEQHRMGPDRYHRLRAKFGHLFEARAEAATEYENRNVRDIHWFLRDLCGIARRSDIVPPLEINICATPGAFLSQIQKYRKPCGPSNLVGE
jgi:hypothetical protein